MTTAPLQHQIDAFNAQARSQLSTDLLQDLTRPIAQLIESGAAEQALTAGAPAPEFTLPDVFGNPVTLSHLLARATRLGSAGACAQCASARRPSRTPQTPSAGIMNTAAAGGQDAPWLCC